MAYLIDGNNLLGRLAAHELRDRAGRDGLIVRLLAFQRVTHTRIHLVFDGRPPDDQIIVLVNAKFTIRYPEEGRSADDVIKNLIERQTDKRRFFVVSSDRDIRDFAKKHGVLTIMSDDFARGLKSALKERKKQRELEKRPETPTPLEIDLWDEVFKGEK